MKKIALTLVLSSIALIGLSQSKNIQNAYNAFRQETDGMKTKINEAKDFIDLAYKHESTSNDPKMWNYRSKIYLEIILKHPNLDKNAVFEATEAHIRCLDRDKKGRIAVRKWTKEEDVLNGLVQCGYNLFNSGVEDYNAKDFSAAIKKYKEIFRIIPLDKDNLLKRGNIVPDAIYYNLFLAALGLEDVDSQIKYLQKSIDNNTNNPKIYYYMSNVYSTKGDLEKALEYINIGKEQFSSEITLINAEIDLYMKMGKSTEEIIQKLTDAIEIDNSNEILFIIRSQQYSLISEMVKAEEDLLEALEINSESASANNNLASLYLTMTEPLIEEINRLDYNRHNKKRIDNLENQIKQLQRSSLPFLIKYISIKESNGEVDKAALDTLATIYHKLKMYTESTETRDYLNSLE